MSERHWKKSWTLQQEVTKRNKMKDSWKNLTWKAIRPALVKFFQSLFSKMTGPIGWIIFQIIPIVIDKLARPAWQWVGRKINKKIRQMKGKKKAKEIRDASTDDIDDIYDNMQQ